MKLDTGDLVLHLQHGLAEVIAMKTSPLPAAVVRIAATKAEHWVPLSAAKEHVMMLPSRDQARAWVASVLEGGARPPSGDDEAEARERTLRYRKLERQLDALRDQYRCGDRGLYAERALEALEEHLLPALAAVLATPIDELRATLRAAMPEPAPPVVEAPLPTLAELEPIGRATLTSTTFIGDQDTVQARTLPGPWLGYVWTRGYAIALVAVHADHAAAWPALRRDLAAIGTASTEGGSAVIYQPSMLDEEADRDMLYDRAGSLGGRGFATSLGGDGDYRVLGTVAGDDLVCLAATTMLSILEERLFRGEAPVDVALDICARWRSAFIGELAIDLDRDEDSMLRDALEILVETDDARASDEIERVRVLIDTAEPGQVSPWLRQARAVLD